MSDYEPKIVRKTIRTLEDAMIPPGPIKLQATLKDLSRALKAFEDNEGVCVSTAGGQLVLTPASPTYGEFVMIIPSKVV